MDALTILIAVAGFLAFFLFYRQWKPSTQNPSDKAKYAPEAAGGWPVIGHLLQLNTHNTMARSLAALADKYGPVFRIRIGISEYLVVSNWEAVQECFTTKDRVFASRPESSSGIYLGYDSAAFGFAPYGPYWREIRKIVMVEVLSSRRLETLRRVRVSEIETSIRELFLLATANRGAPSAKVVMSEWLEQLSLNMIVRTIAGKRYTDGEVGAKVSAQHFRKVVREYMRISGLFGLSDVVPFRFIQWFDQLGNIKTMKRVSKEMDSITQIWIDEHIESSKRDSQKRNDEQDFIDVMLSAIKDDFLFGHSRETVIKATVLNLILAGSDTTSIHLTWLLSLLVNNKDVMKQAQEEIDKTVGRERWVEESDIKNLGYLQAIIKEALRLYPPGPMSVPHLAMEDTEVSGYRVPKGTRLSVNVWKLHRDPRIWSEPDKFMPERFLTRHAELDVSGKHFEFTPFGSGRRACPGITFAMQVTHLTLARLIQGFSFANPSDFPVDMTEGQGLTMPKVDPLEVLIVPRLDYALYLEPKINSNLTA